MVEQHGRKERRENLKLEGQNIQLCDTNGNMLPCEELIIMPVYCPGCSVRTVVGPFFSGLGKDVSHILQRVELNYIASPFQQTLKMLKSYCF